MADQRKLDDEEKAGLQDEARQLAGSVRSQFLLMLGTGAFMLIALSVSDETLISGQETVTIPILEMPTSLSSVILAGPIILAGLLCYMHLLLGRLSWLSAQGINPPQTDFFTIREPVARAVADICFYVAAPLSCGWFFLRTIFRPEAGWLLAIFCLTLMVCSIAWFQRSRSLGAPMRLRMAQAYLGSSALLVIGAGATFAFEGRAPSQKAASLMTELELSGADLSGLAANVSFRGFNFDGQCLSGANLSGLDLAGASFVGADLSQADLSGALLDGAVLDGASLDGANLTGTALPGASLRQISANRISAQGIILDDADLTASRMTKAQLARASMLRTQAQGLNLRQATMQGARLSSATLDCADFREVDGTRMLFQSVSSAQEARFDDATLTRSNFNTGNFDGAVFTRAQLSGSTFGAASLDGVVFDRAITDGVDFEAAGVFAPASQGTISSCPIAGLPAAPKSVDACR
ncbi:MAG: pentapeptide repeat-containing protein [Pseudomonadota bacterium]